MDGCAIKGVRDPKHACGFKAFGIVKVGEMTEAPGSELRRSDSKTRHLLKKGTQIKGRG